MHNRLIKSLTLDLIDWATTEKIWADGLSQCITQRTTLPDNFFASAVSGIKSGEKGEILLSDTAGIDVRPVL